jgi:hypothetical protein
MNEEPEARRLNRRRMLRRGATVVAGVAGVGVAGAVAAAPADAATGDPVLIGTSNDGGTATTEVKTAGAAAALKVTNTGGAALVVSPLPPAQITTAAINAAAPGSLFVDTFGDVTGVGNTGGANFPAFLYSPTWAAMPFPVQQTRILDTRPSSSTFDRSLVLAGSTFDSAGRLQPKNSATLPDLTLDLRPILLPAAYQFGAAAIQVNFTVVSATAAGFAAMWDTDVFPVPGISSINYQANTAVANFCQSVVGTDGRVRIKTNKPVAVILDVVGFILPDPFVAFNTSSSGAPAARAMAGRFAGKRPTK